jgi:hypothetical protein
LHRLIIQIVVKIVTGLRNSPWPGLVLPDREFATMLSKARAQLEKSPYIDMKAVGPGNELEEETP